MITFDSVLRQAQSNKFVYHYNPFYCHMRIVRVLLLLTVPVMYSAFSQSGNTGESITESVCFKRDIQPLLNSNCAQSHCHDSQFHRAGLVLNSYDDMRKIITAGNPDSSLLYQIILTDGMPQYPYSTLPDSMKRVVYNWILQGAPNNTCTESTCDSLNVHYIKDVKPIIQRACVGCHQGSSAAAGFALDDDQANQKYSLAILKSIEGRGVAQMPHNIEPLSSCDQAFVRRWAQVSSDVTNQSTLSSLHVDWDRVHPGEFVVRIENQLDISLDLDIVNLLGQHIPPSITIAPHSIIDNISVHVPFASEAHLYARLHNRRAGFTRTFIIH